MPAYPASAVSRFGAPRDVRPHVCSETVISDDYTMARVAAPPAGADESLYFALEHRGSGRASGNSRRKDRARNPEAAKKALVISYVIVVLCNRMSV